MSRIWAPVSLVGACEATEPETATPRVSTANGNALRLPATSVALSADEDRANETSGLLLAPKSSAFPAPEPTGRVIAVEPVRSTIVAEPTVSNDARSASEAVLPAL